MAMDALHSVGHETISLGIIIAPLQARRCASKAGRDSTAIGPSVALVATSSTATATGPKRVSVDLVGRGLDATSASHILAANTATVWLHGCASVTKIGPDFCANKI